MLAGEPLIALIGLLFIFVCYALFIGVEFVLLRVFGQEPNVAAPTAVDLLRAWASEVARTPAIFCWRQPFRAGAEPDFVSSADRGRRSVLLVHGFMCNRAFWNPWMSALRSLGVPFAALSLEPPLASIDQFAPSIDAAVGRLVGLTGRPPIIVAHSMGGLAVRAWMNRFQAADRVHRVITVGSPHHGTWLAQFFHTPNGIQMRRGSSWLEALSAAESSASRSRFICFYGDCDNIVFPASTATLPGADNRAVKATAHVQMAFSKPVFDTLLEVLDGDSREPATLVTNSVTSTGSRESIH